MKFTLVSTVFNEARRLEQTIQDLTNQKLTPAEIIITDAGSTDGTYEMLFNWQKRSAIPIVILKKKGCNVAEGRNMAIKASSYNLIASTDFGCRFHPDWLKSIIEPFEADDIDVVGGAYTTNEEDITTLPAKAAYILANGYNVNVNTTSFIPSSRSIAFRKEVYNKIGGYCEWLTLAADDTIFGLEIKANCFKIHIVDKAYVSWGRHKQAKGYFKEAYRYGLGDGEGRVNGSLLIRNIAILLICIFFLLALIALPVAVILHSNIFAVTIIITLLPISLGLYIFYLKRWLKFKSSKYNSRVLIYSFGLLMGQKINYLKGYFRGVVYSKKEIKIQAANLHQRLKAFPC